MDLKPQYSNRVSALNSGTKSLLQSIGAWKHIASARYKTVKKLQVQKCMYITYVEQTVWIGPCFHLYWHKVSHRFQSQVFQFKLKFLAPLLCAEQHS